jgi:hypothetical protein
VQNEYSWPKRFRHLRVISLLLCLLVVACNKPQPPSNPEPKPGVTSTGVVKAMTIATDIARGQSGEATVRLRIVNGYHVNANPASFPYLIPTQLELTPAAGISVDSINYPGGVTKTFSFSPDQPLNVYEGETDLKLRLKADKSAQPGAHNLSAKLRVQACDDQVCYAPGTMDLTLPVNIR